MSWSATVSDAPTRHATRPIAPDRVGLPVGWLLAAAAASALTLGLAAAAVPSPQRSSSTLFLMGAGSAALGIVALRSLSIQRVARTQAVVAAVLATRLGVMSGGVAGTRTLVWLGIAVTSIVLASYIDHRRRPMVVGSKGGGWLAVPIGVIGVALAAAVLVGPTLATSISAGVSLGDLPGRPSQPLSRTDGLDMSNRPDLGDEVLFSVGAARPAFWRTATLDEWDGQAWGRQQPALLGLDPGGVVRPAPDDLGATTGTLLVQDVRIESDGAQALPAAASAVRIESPQPIGQYVDGTLAAPFLLGRGSTYRVTSRVPAADPNELRATDGAPIPQSIARTWATRPMSSDRTKALARTLAERAASTYDRVQAIEAWLGDNTRYSLDAPLTPTGRDVVDHFLFESKLGWCEQVASSMVVLLREMGVPARVATGFVPGERDPLSGRYVVRANDAHSWTEVWFPRYGWVPFDPTAGVPQAGDQPGSTTARTWLDALAVAVLVVGALLALVPLLSAAARWVWSRRWSRRAGTPAVRAAVGARTRELERWLEHTGRRVGAPRRDDETATTFARRLADQGVPGPVRRCGEVIDEVRYDPTLAGRDDDPRIDELLVSARGAGPRSS